MTKGHTGGEGTVVRLLDILAPTYLQMLKALSARLDKAEAQMPDGRAEVLLSARLAPDMFPLSTQIRFACVQAPTPLFRQHDVFAKVFAN